MASNFSTAVSSPRRFVLRYSIGSKVCMWETHDFTPELAKARFFKQRFTNSVFSPVRVLDVFEVLEVLDV